MALPSSLAPLRHRSFAQLTVANVVSLIGTWMQSVAVGVFVADRTGQAGWTALVAAAAFLPMGVLSPLGGALADRVDRRRFLIAANVGQAVLAAGLAVLVASGHATPLNVTLVTLVMGCADAVRVPFAQAMLPDLVPAEDLLAAISLGSAQYNLGRIAGPVLAAVVIAVGGFSWAFALNAASYAAIIAVLVGLRLPARPEPEPGVPREGLWAGIRAGARVAAEEPGCRTALVTVGLASLLAAPFIGLIAFRARELVGDDEDAIARAAGFLTSAQGVGAILGALALAPLAVRYGRDRVVTAALGATVAALCAYAYAPELPVALLAMVGLGASYIGLLAGLQTVVQLRAPAAFRGRVLSLHLTALGVLFPIGTMIHGPVADRIGLAPTTAGSALLLVVVLALLSARGRWSPALLADLPAIAVTPAPVPATGGAGTSGA